MRENLIPGMYVSQLLHRTPVNIDGPGPGRTRSAPTTGGHGPGQVAAATELSSQPGLWPGAAGHHNRDGDCTSLLQTLAHYRVS